LWILIADQKFLRFADHARGSANVRCL